MTATAAEAGRQAWSAQDLHRLVAVQHAVLRHRADVVDVAADRQVAAQAVMDTVHRDELSLRRSPSTVHVSVVGDDGSACAITVSAGYNSGVLVPGTGIWLNNCLGEEELTPRGAHGEPPGARLLSAMAPTVGRRDDGGAVLAIGSPGSDRIPTSIAQVLALHLEAGVPLEEAVRKATSLPARRMGLAGRGVVRVGNYADLVVFDPRTVIDTATTARPQSPPVGISHVWVNGQLVLDNGKVTGARPGMVLRRRARTAMSR